MSKSTGLTRQVASDLVAGFNRDRGSRLCSQATRPRCSSHGPRKSRPSSRRLKTKLISTKRSRISEAIANASQQLKDRPEGSRHVVLITDGVDSPGVKVDREEAVKKLIAARATVHVISYTEFVRQKSDKKDSIDRSGPRPPSSDPITATDPTLPPGTTRSPSYGISIRFDPAMRKQRKAYEAEVKKSQQAVEERR